MQISETVSLYITVSMFIDMSMQRPIVEFSVNQLNNLTHKLDSSMK